jgi:hypothetical protein
MLNVNNQQSAGSINRLLSYLKRHKVAVGLLLATYGSVYLFSVLLGGWTIYDWGKDVTSYPPSQINPLLPRSFVPPIFFVTSFPCLLAGTAILCVYTIQGIQNQAVSDKEHIAILLVAAGFFYQIAGAWPLTQIVDYQWEWQKQIASNGPAVTWVLYLLSLAALSVGAVSVFVQSRIYHQKHPELAKERQC